MVFIDRPCLPLSVTSRRISALRRMASNNLTRETKKYMRPQPAKLRKPSHISSLSSGQTQRHDFPTPILLPVPLQFYLPAQVIGNAMPGPARSQADQQQRVVQPPRPPNAWILYRSDKIRELPPVAPGYPRRAQAEVSKMISDMWKTAPDHIRQHYEHLADRKKAEHQALYPGYRFQPMKKEEKERLKEEKRLEKEKERASARRRGTRHAPYPAATSSTAPMPQIVQMYRPEAPHTLDGPSPPNSAASSPSYSLGSPDSGNGMTSPTLQSSTPSSHPSPCSSDPTSSHPSPSPHPSLHSLLIAAPQPSVPILPPSSDINMWQSTPSPQPPSGNTEWSQYPITPSQSPTEPLSLDVPQQALEGWDNNQLAQFNDWFQMNASLLPTNEDGVFSLSGLPEGFDFEADGRELQLNFGQQDQAFLGDTEQLNPIDSFSTDLFPQLSISGDPGPSTQSSTAAAKAAQSPPHSRDSSYPPSTRQAEPPQSRQRYSYGGDMMEFVNLEPTTVTDTPSPRPSSHQTYPVPMPLQDSNVDTKAHTPYQPPAGAIHSNTRRVAASWKPSFVDSRPDSPIDRSPPRELWGVSAN